MQASQQSRKSLTVRAGLGTYHFIWLVMAFVASGYLTTVALQPGAIDRLAVAAGLPTESDRGPVLADRGELEAITQSVARVEQELVGLRRESATQRDMTAAINNRVAAIEARLERDDVKAGNTPPRESGSPGRQDYMPVKPFVVGSAQQEPPSAADRRLLRGSDNGVDQNVTSLPKVLNGRDDFAMPEASQIVTGSIGQDSIPPPIPNRAPASEQRQAAAAVQPAAEPEKSFGLEIARDTTVDGLREKWQTLSVKNRAQLNGLGARYRLVVSKDGDPLRLVAGPIVGEAKARRLCTDLAVLGTRCRLTAFGGDPL